MRSDERKQGEKNPNINFAAFIYKNYKDVIAVLLIIFFTLILVFKDNLGEGVETLLISLISGASGFIFGKKVD